MSSFDFGIILNIHEAECLKRGFFIWIWYADKIPPHIGCSSNGKYFSLKVNGKDENSNVSVVFSIIHRKKIPAVIVRLKNNYSIETVKNTYSKFKKTEIGKSTCLTPITELLDCSSGVFQLSNLLLYLKNNNQIDSVFGLNLTNDYQGIPAYTLEDIENRLRKLEDAKIQKHIPSIG